MQSLTFLCESSWISSYSSAGYLSHPQQYFYANKCIQRQDKYAVYCEHNSKDNVWVSVIYHSKLKPAESSHSFWLDWTYQLPWDPESFYRGIIVI